MIRTMLLAASRSRVLATWLPRFPPVRSAMQRFMPGEARTDALGAALKLEEGGVGSVLTHLGEDVVRDEEVRAVLDEYLAVVEAAFPEGPAVELSVKPSQFGLHVDPERCGEAIATLAQKVEEAGSFLWIDMERSSDVEATLRIYEEVLRRHPSTGVCLQAYLHRTEEDVQRLTSPSFAGGHAAAIRLVKGAYREAPSIALTDRGKIDERFVALAQRIRSRSDSGVRLALGTHHGELIHRLTEAEAFPSPGDRGWAPVEVHMLYGIRTDLQRQLRSDGVPLRILISYGAEWYPWFVRRLAERPSNLRFLLQRPGRDPAGGKG